MELAWCCAKDLIKLLPGVKAIKFECRCDGALELTIHREPAGCKKVCLSVEDVGTEHAFDKLVQALIPMSEITR